MNWDYRIIRHEADKTKGTEVWLAIHEVHYENGNYSWTENPIDISGCSPDGIRWILTEAQKAFNKPVLVIDGDTLREETE